MKLQDLNDDVPEWITSTAKHKKRYFVKINPKDRWLDKLRVRFIGDKKIVADVWGWDQANHEMAYIDEITLPLKALHHTYKQLTDPDEIRHHFQDVYKEILKRNKKLG